MRNPVWIAAIPRSAPEPPPSVTVTAPPAISVTFVFPLTSSCPIVCVVTLVAMVVAPLLNISTSFEAGAMRLGVQFVAVPNAPVPVWFQV